MAAAPRRLLQRPLAWLETSVRRRLTAAMLAVALAFALAVGGTTLLAARWQLQKNLDARVEGEALLEARRVGYPITAVAEGVAALARNPLLGHTLENPAEHRQFLDPILHDFRAVGGLRVKLVLCDADGALLASGVEGGHPGYPGAGWLRAAVEIGLPNVALTTDGHPALLLVEPVLRPGAIAPDGALVAELDLASSLGARGGADPFRVRISDGADRVLADSGGAASWAGLVSSRAAVAGSPLLQEAGLKVQVGAPPPRVLGALWGLLLAYGVGALLLTAAAVAVATPMADRLTRPILRLSEAAARIGERGSAEGGVPVEGNDEVARLARVFNQVLQRLDQATEERVAAIHAMQLELHQAQKLEAVGRLAAGIAHEINTPIQYIGDNTRFLAEAFGACTTMLDRQAAALEAHAPPEVRAGLEEAAEELDLGYVREQTGSTIQRTLQGTDRVATIVRAMKEFAHPDQKAMVATDLNRALQATLDVARNEYKYVADVETTYGDIPMVTCHAGDLNQVFLNIVVNAAHAIGDVVGESGKRGTIRVATARDGTGVRVSIADTGGGIPEEIREKIYEPFFTTKEVGKGTGQGLAIARSIVDKHGGSIRFDSDPGSGTTFHITLPEVPPQAAAGSPA